MPTPTAGTGDFGPPERRAYEEEGELRRVLGAVILERDTCLGVLDVRLPVCVVSWPMKGVNH